MAIVLGAIADDLTGATDLANTWANEGLSVAQVIGVPEEKTSDEGADAVVVALKSRTAPADVAVEQSLDALGWLRTHGVQQVTFKYCSTFDSTASGNIGPVADALLDALKVEFAIVCPAFPRNRRTVYQGYLFVDDQLLSDSPMKDHPLTPMHDASLIRLMEAQSRYSAGLVPLQVVQRGVRAIREQIDQLQCAGKAYGIADAVTERDLRILGKALSGHRLVTGGSGIGIGLPANHFGEDVTGRQARRSPPQVKGRDLVIAGSCSATTRAQISSALGIWPTRKIDVDRIVSNAGEIDATVKWAQNQNDGTPVLVYSSADPAEVEEIQARYGKDSVGAKVESALGCIAADLHLSGFNRIIVAGGETAGAVVSALDVKELRIGPEIAPGVPWTEARGEQPLALALKSGNFGATTFFQAAFGMLP